MTNREWLNSLSDEDFTLWCLFNEDVDYTQFITHQPAPRLLTIISSWNDSYSALLHWLKQERKNDDKILL